jgi:hypothetical protein
VRIAGALALDCGHGIGNPCHETENDRSDPDTNNLEIHPVYSVDFIQNFIPHRRSVNLTGVWAASDVGTYYVRQVGDTVWWLGLSRDQGTSFANVFRGTVIPGASLPGGPPPVPVIMGDWADVPLGPFQNGGRLTLSGMFCVDPSNPHLPCDSGAPSPEWNVLETRSTDTGVFANYRWEKLYDTNLQIMPPS